MVWCPPLLSIIIVTPLPLAGTPLNSKLQTSTSAHIYSQEPIISMKDHDDSEHHDGDIRQSSDVNLMQILSNDVSLCHGHASIMFIQYG